MHPEFSPTDIIRSFDRAASTYAAADMLPREIGQRLLERLPLMRLQPQLAIDLGCANGHLSKALAKHYPKARVIGVDIAFNMLARAKKQTGWLDRERFICADAHHLPFADESVDLIFSNLMLAWSHDINLLLSELRRVLKPQGLLLFTTFGPDTLQELKNSWKNIDHYEHIHPFIDMHDIGDSLIKNKFLDPVMDMEKLMVNYAQLQTLMDDLKSLGMHNIFSGRKKGLTTPRQLKQLKQMFECYRNTDGTFPTTLEIIYGHAWSYTLPQSSINSQGEAVIPISKIKRKHT